MAKWKWEQGRSDLSSLIMYHHIPLDVLLSGQTWTMSLSAYRPCEEILSSSPSSSIISGEGNTSVKTSQEAPGLRRGSPTLMGLSWLRAFAGPWLSGDGAQRSVSTHNVLSVRLRTSVHKGKICSYTCEPTVCTKGKSCNRAHAW